MINTCVRRRTWESLCDKHTDTSQLKPLLFPPTSDMNAITSRNCPWSGGLFVQTHKRLTDRRVGNSRLSVGTRDAELSYSHCQRTGEWGISVLALAPVTELRTVYRALLCLGENSSRHNQDGVGKRGQIIQREAMPSVSWPYSLHSQRFLALCTFFLL